MKKLAIAFYKFEGFHINKEYLLKALKNRGHEISVFTTKKIDSKKAPYNIISLNLDEYYSGAWLSKNEYDVLLIYHLNINEKRILKKAKEMGIKVITKADHNGFFPILGSDLIRNNFYYKSKQFVRALLYFRFKLKMNELLNLNDYIMLETSTAYRRFVTHFHAHHKKFIIIPYGYDFEKIEFNNKLNRIIAIGRWDDLKQKRINRLLSAFSKIKKKWKGYELFIIGPYQERTKSKHKLNSVYFLGEKNREEINDLLTMSQITVMSSEWESFGYVQIEALSKGNTVVSTPHVGAIDVIHGFEFGLVSQGYSAKELSHALSAEISLWSNGMRNPGLIFAKAKEYYDWAVICEQMEKLFD